MEMQRAACEDCGKTFRVPEPERTYTCRACGGTVRAAPRVEEPELQPACDACGAILVGEPSFCEECGAAVGEPPAPSRRARDGRDDHDGTERRRAASELVRAHRWIKLLRVFYVINAVLFGLLLAGAIFALSAPELPVGAVVLMIGLLAGATALFVVGAIQIAFQPFLWAVLLAAASTLVRALELAIEPQLNWIGLAWTALLWAAVIPTVPTRRLMREHPDLYIAQRIHGTQRSRHGGGRDRRAHARRQTADATRRARRWSAGAAAAVLAIAALGAGSVYATARPQELEPALERFRGAWNAADVREALDVATDDAQARIDELLNRGLVKRGWTVLPALGAFDVDETGDARARVSFEAGEGTVETLWRRDGNAWRLAELLLPPPPIDRAVSAFEAAWNSGSAERIAELFDGDDVARQESAFRKLADRSGWTGGFPAISGRDVSLRPTGASVEHESAAGALGTSWKLVDDEWRLRSVRPPRE